MMKILPIGVAVIEGDTHIGKWVEEYGSLAIAEKMLAPFRKYVPSDSTVIDVGANIGDHTVTYAKWVGSGGSVIAIEPVPEIFDCLCFNMKGKSHVVPMNIALSDKDSIVAVQVSENAGASYLMEDCEGRTDLCMTVTLDSFDYRGVSFIKIDAEGFETKILRGATKTIFREKPAMLIEVNDGALLRAGSSKIELRDLIESLGYNTEITDRRLSWKEPQFDILCVMRGSI